MSEENLADPPPEHAAPAELETDQRLRVCVMREILSTERDYVRTLDSLISTSLERMRHSAILKVDKNITEETAQVLFGNIEEIVAVHRELLQELEACLQPKPQPEHELGSCFLPFIKRFHVYQHYCSNNEKAQKLYQDICRIPSVQSFFLECMMLWGQQYSEISLEGYLMYPVQRICKYPLLLKELLKRTPKSHVDYESVSEALDAMKSICSSINETKRRVEQLEALQDWQGSVEGWEGPNITDTCSEMLKQGTLLKISAGNIQERMFFLFDSLLVYCKKKSKVPGKSRRRTLSRKNSIIALATSEATQYQFRGRINLSVTEVENVEDGAVDVHSCGFTVSFGWKFHNTVKDKWVVCMARSAEEKQSWLDAIVGARGRNRGDHMGLEQDAWTLMAKKGEKLYNLMKAKGRLIRDRKKKLTSIPKCFLGTEFVTWLVEIGEVSKPEEGVNLGQALLENGIIHHVADKHHFKQEAVLYRFRYDDGTFRTRSEMQDMIAKGLRIYCRLHSTFKPMIKDRDHHLSTYKSVVVAHKFVDWLLAQGDSSTRDEAVSLGTALCNSGFLHHVQDKSEFKDDSLLFRFYADEESATHGGSKRQAPRPSRNDMKVVETMTCKSIMVKFHPEGYGFDLQDTQKGYVVKSVEPGSSAAAGGLRAGRKLCTVRGDLVFLRPFKEVEMFLEDCFWQNHNLEILVATKHKELVQVPISDQLGFKLRGSSPAFVYAVAQGSEAANAGLLPGQRLLKLNNTNISKCDHRSITLDIIGLASFTQATHREASDWVYSSTELMEQPYRRSRAMSLLSLCHGSSEEGFDSFLPTLGNITDNEEEEEEEDEEGADADATGESGLVAGFSSFCMDRADGTVSLSVENPYVESSVAHEYDSTAGVKCFVLERLAEPTHMLLFCAKVIETMVMEDENFLKDCKNLDELMDSVPEELQEEFEKIREMKSAEISQRISDYKKFAQTLRSCTQPLFRPASSINHVYSAMAFVPANCHLNLLDVSYPRISSSLRSSFGMRTERPKSMIDLEDGNGGRLKPMVYTHHGMTTLAAPVSVNIPGKTGNVEHQVPSSNLHTHNSFLQLLIRLEVAMSEMEQYVQQIDSLLASITAPVSREEVVLERERRKVAFGTIEEQDDSGTETATSTLDSYGSDSHSNRDSVLSCTSVSSSLRSSWDEVPGCWTAMQDKQDKLYGSLEHLFNQVTVIVSLLKGPSVQEAFELTRYFTPNKRFQDFIQEAEVKASYVDTVRSHMQEDPWNLPMHVNTVIQSIRKHIDDLKIQMTLALLQTCDGRAQRKADVTLCQLLGAMAAAFSDQLLAATTDIFNPMREYGVEGSEASRKWLEHIASIGLIFNLQSMLSPALPNEKHSIKSINATLSDLEKVTFQLLQAPEDAPLAMDSALTSNVHGNRQALHVTFSLESDSFLKLPERLRSVRGIKVNAVFFTQALHTLEEWSSAEQQSSPDEFQSNVNLQSFKKLQAYYRKFRNFYMEKARNPSNSGSKNNLINKLLRPLQAMDDLHRLIELQLSKVTGTPTGAHHSGVSLLPLSWELCDRLSSCHILLCDNGVHRCTLAVTLYQALILARCHGLPPCSVFQAMDKMRKEGTRVENDKKNHGVRNQTPSAVPRLFQLFSHHDTP
uniref:phosphatidylinositol 3,4,5-trisphosphate-dependent Rac exchanger 2 protein-like n=1 Tax=Myxine glutinosa TaxID=7769 RepID=UPI00358EF05E